MLIIFDIITFKVYSKNRIRDKDIKLIDTKRAANWQPFSIRDESRIL